MNDEQRTQIRDNARYLRQVRPIDPEEICEYIEGTPHPAAVRQVLREEAVELGLIERDDGSFEPVSDEPVSVSFAGVERLAPDIHQAVEELLVAEFGAGWPDGRSGDTLRDAIREFKQRYLTGESVTYDTETALGYAVYHLPAYFATVQYVLSELITDGLLPSDLRVLDVGAGVGGPALGMDQLLPDETLIEYHAVEPSAAIEVLEPMLETTGRNFHSEIHHQPIEEFEPTESFDIVLFGNVLSELQTPAAVLDQATEWLTDDGTIVAIAPADRKTAIQLRQLERDIEQRTDATVYSPTVRLWPDETPSSESWSFTRKPDLETPDMQTQLDTGARARPPQRAAGSVSSDDSDVASEADTARSPRKPGDGEFVNVDIQYAYSMLRTDGARAIEFTPNERRFAAFSKTETHVTDRIDCVAVKLSHNLAERGNPLYLLGDGSQDIDHFAVLTEPSALNEALERAAYGDLLSFENVLVLWNDDEGAYNLVVDGETFVERIPV